jgi:hypothetical protein
VTRRWSAVVVLDRDANICSVPEYGFTLTEYDPTRPWIVRGNEHRTITLDDDASFFEWAQELWPAPQWTVDLDPWQLAPDRRR